MIRSISATALLLVFLVMAGAHAAEPFRYPEGKHGGGELRYVNGLPVLVVQGNAGEMGEQIGVLAIKPAAALFGLTEEFLESRGWEALYPVLLKIAGGMSAQFPPDHLAELEAAARASGQPKELLVFANVAEDLLKFGGCSAWIVEPTHSATGGPLFGRNLDWPPLENLHEHCLVTVYRPKGKRAFAVIGYPAMFGAASGINEAGLAVAVLEVNQWADGSQGFSPAGVPYNLLLRQILEECATVDEAEEMFRAAKRTTAHNVAICDKNGGVVFEATVKQVAVRRAVDGFCACTNHFRTDGLAINTECRRYAALDIARDWENVAVDDVIKRLDVVNQGPATLQAMIFETASGKLHLAFGPGPATRLPFREVDLGALFAHGFEGIRR